MLKSAILGAASAVIASIVWAGLVALIFRFPVPFVGYQSGPDAFGTAMFAAIFYLILGGAFPQAALGTLAGVFAHRCLANRGHDPWSLASTLGIISALPGVLLLAILDWIIGPW